MFTDKQGLEALPSPRLCIISSLLLLLLLFLIRIKILESSCRSTNTRWPRLNLFVMALHKYVVKKNSLVSSSLWSYVGWENKVSLERYSKETLEDEIYLRLHVSSLSHYTHALNRLCFTLARGINLLNCFFLGEKPKGSCVMHEEQRVRPSACPLDK